MINIELDFSCFERTTNKFHKKKEHTGVSPEMYQHIGVNIFNTRTKLTSMNVGSIEITL